MEWHIGLAGSPVGYGEAKHHTGIWERWDGKLELAEQKRNGLAPLIRVHQMMLARKLCVYQWHCDSPVWSWDLKDLFTHLCPLCRCVIAACFPCFCFVSLPTSPVGTESPMPTTPSPRPMALPRLPNTLDPPAFPASLSRSASDLSARPESADRAAGPLHWPLRDISLLQCVLVSVACLSGLSVEAHLERTRRLDSRADRPDLTKNHEPTFLRPSIIHTR